MLKQLVVWILLTLIFLEIGLRITKLYTTWSERTGQGYVSYYGQVRPTWYNTYAPDTTFYLDHGDFKYLYKTNSLGIREAELSEPENDSTCRILTLGDSFTDGVGAPLDSSWPKMLQADLNRENRNVDIYNAGISGADPFYEYTLLRDKLLKYKPNIVMVGINSSDITDYVFRGGFERFRPNGTTVFRKGPWFESLYKYSHVARFVVTKLLRYDNGNLFIKRKQLAGAYSQATTGLLTACDSIKQLGVMNHFQTIFVLHPMPLEIAKRKDEVSPTYREAFETMKTAMATHGLVVVDLWNSFDGTISSTNYSQYAHPTDGHFTGKGYQLFAEKVNDQLKSRNLLHSHN